MRTCKGCVYNIYNDHRGYDTLEPKCNGCYNWSVMNEERIHYVAKPIKQLYHPEGFIADISSMDTGGGCIVDFVHLKDGRILGINDETMVLYKDMEQFGCGDDIPPEHIIDLLKK